MIFAFIVSRFKQVPVRTYEWFLLFIGVSNGNQGVMILFVMWFAYMYWREQNNTIHKKTGLFNLNQIFAAGMTLFVIGTLLNTIHKNLVRSINMHIQGNGSYSNLLKWYTDVIDTTIPEVSIISIPVLPYRILMLIWSFWLVSAMLRWSQWAFEAISKNGIWIGIDWDTVKRDIKNADKILLKEDVETNKEQSSQSSDDSDSTNKTTEESKAEETKTEESQDDTSDKTEKPDGE